MKREYLEKLCCPTCRQDFQLNKKGLFCRVCRSLFPVEGNIIYILPKQKEKIHWDKLYENEKEVIKNAEFFLQHKNAIATYYSSLSVLQHHEKIKDALEIGCGTGSYSLFLKKLGLAKNVFLVDYSVAALQLAQKLFHHFNEDAVFVCADAFALPFKDRAFDVSFSSGLIEHFTGARQEKLVFEHCRAARKTLIQVPYNNTIYQTYKKAYILVHGGWPFGFEKPLKKKELKKLLLRQGMKIEKTFYHDLLTAMLFQLSKQAWLAPQTKKNIFNRFFRHEVGMLAVAQNES